MVKARKDLTKPKKATTSWMYFCNDKRKELLEGGMKVTEAAKELGRLWAELSDVDKAPYVESAEKDKERYAKEIKDYVPPPKPKEEVAEDADDDDSHEGKKKKVKKVKKESKPRKPSGYILYGTNERPNIKKENPDMRAPDVMKAIGAGWKALSDKERIAWNEKAANA